ncbi:pyruvate,water dikinase [Thermocatellispora tengchongensis]|uniref:Pyruvate,water dikinase n=1 Tax=Thermocatellispora tengchongensis TaxID=1073253 RepID=A0A840PLH2_9ACTN|nr:PEP-utilizing enzyme [Thermocatellispora tengchongensis]MBB5137907.1 pyruvate,water dikinase [Thermocatellispora tengchongensis]
MTATSPQSPPPPTPPTSEPTPQPAAAAVPGVRFASPFAVPTPPGAEGWESMYPYYALLSEDRRKDEDARFWFFDGMHNPEPLYPFDTIATENWWVAVSQMSTRVWPIPLAGGIDHRIVNGYLYVSPTAVTDQEQIAARARHFAERAGHYYENWDEIYAGWEAKARDCIERLKAIDFAPLPDLEPLESVTGGRGLYSSYDLLTRYTTLINNFFEMGSYHFEMLNLGYGAYLTFREFCQAAFPGISDQTIASMVSGIDIMLFRPDDEVRKLAALAVELGLDRALLSSEDPDEALAAVAGAGDPGARWLAAFEAAKDPWFWFSTGAGYQHSDRAWIDDLRLPFRALRGYIAGLRAGEDIRRPLEAITEERERVTAEYRSYLPTDEDRESFDGLVALARKVFPFVENHNFYVEHWHHSMFWSKVRSLGRVFVAHGFFDDEEDIFYLHRTEVQSALYDLLIGWGTGIEPRGVTYWRPEIARRRRIREALKAHSPAPALGVPPEFLTEPLTIMLWGITPEAVQDWLGVADSGERVLRGVAASPGRAVGRARVILDPEQLHEVRDGEILVCRITAPSWAPVFSRLAAAVSDVGGIMAHTAIVCREYGLPSVVGTGFATTTVRTGELLEVDGDTGTVRVLEEPEAAEDAGIAAVGA